MKATIAGVEVEGEPTEIAQLIRAFSGVAGGRGAGRAAAPSAGTGAPVRAKRKAVSPAVQKARQLQGQFMGLTRQLKGADKAKIQQILKTKGKEAAIAEARRMLASK